MERQRNAQFKQDIEILKKRLEFEEQKLKKIEAKHETDLRERRNELDYERGRLNLEKNDNSDLCAEDEKRVQLKIFELEDRRKMLSEKESKLLK